ncbi:hypothetical protein GQ457_10G013360 [Hibiscus cannabinus]
MHSFPYSFKSNYTSLIVYPLSPTRPTLFPCPARPRTSWFSLDQACNPLRPKASSWAVPVLALEDRRISVHPILL